MSKALKIIVLCGQEFYWALVLLASQKRRTRVMLSFTRPFVRELCFSIIPAMRITLALEEPGFLDKEGCGCIMQTEQGQPVDN
jgi:hypothetical protein